MQKKEKGITLIALVVTIIVLLILAGISISMLTGDNGLITRAKEGKDKNKIAEYQEALEFVRTELQIEKSLNQWDNQTYIEQYKVKIEEEARVESSLKDVIVYLSSGDKLQVKTKEGYLFEITEGIVTYRNMLEVVDLNESNTTFSCNPNTRTTGEVTVTITTTVSPETNAFLQYSFDKKTWTNYTKPFSVSKNCQIYARILDGECAKGTVDNIIDLETISTDEILEKYTTIEIANNTDGVLQKVLKNPTSEAIKNITSSKDAMTILGKNMQAKQEITKSDAWCEAIENSAYRDNFSKYFIYTANSLCATGGGRNYYKKNNGFALCVYCWDRGANLMFIGRSKEAVLGYCSYDVNTISPANEISYNGEKWYYSDLYYTWLNGTEFSSYRGVFINKTNDVNTVIYALNDFFGNN